MNLEQLSKEDKRKLGILPSFDSEDASIITYGLYPQTNVSDLDLIKELNKLEKKEEENYYIYNNSYYFRLPYRFKGKYDLREPLCSTRSNNKFDNGARINSYSENDLQYNFDEYKIVWKWFKCEPIKWKILEQNKHTKTMISLNCLDCCYFNSKASKGKSYLESFIREWLNTYFYNMAFGLDNAYLIKTNIKNSVDETAPLIKDYSVKGSKCTDTKYKYE